MTAKRKVFESLNIKVNLTQRENQLLDNTQFKICIHAGPGKCLHIDNLGNYYFETIPDITNLKLK